MSVPIFVCPSILYISGVLCECVRVLACVVARIDRLMPKRKFPEFCEGLPKQAGIKIVYVCVCVWRTVLVAVVGEDDCILEKERQRGEGMDIQCVSALSLVPALSLS